MEKFVVTPWEVKGEVNYDKLVKDFGTKKIDEKLLKRVERLTGKLHYMLRRGLFFSHRDFDIILNEYEKGQQFALYTGRGPSGQVHLGHLMPWIFTKYLQDKFGTELYFQMTDDEKFLFGQKEKLEETNKLAYENALDVIAVGFDPKKTFIFADTDYAKTLYPIAIKVARLTTFSTAKAVFGFKNESNIGSIFYPAMQAAPCFLPSILKGRNTRVLIPAAIDQDPYWRITRDVAPKLGFPKPAAIHSKFIPGLAEGGKMSASIPDSCIFTTDKPEDAKRKVMKAFTGGAATVEEQRKHGGKPEICSVFQYYAFLFEDDDKKLEERRNACKSGALLCGECKKELAERVAKFLKEHQKKREQAKKQLDKFVVKD
ncbi:MAG: tryptophan--tRNA ligase [Candidatus Diapherotrites archaeon]|nr:tryptophan--tRNA ligase [Candidatus Diapherotrites archaeon]